MFMYVVLGLTFLLALRTVLVV